ncbi:MAG: hypothetical protein GF329_03445 [Candidatus Lokiarchaeota archaeon]|nr:hypothetical protein [Candidatus Lokiarchaeota archaeon]
MIVLTGFEKFGHFTENLSEKITQIFPETIQDIPIIKKVLPVSWRFCFEVYKNLLKTINIKPELVVMMGVYLGKRILIERYGWNIAIGLDYYNKYRFGFIKLTDPLRETPNIDFKKLISIINKPNKISLSSYPGFYLCNYIYFQALYMGKGNYPIVFIHLPSKWDIQDLKNNIIHIINVIISDEKK